MIQFYFLARIRNKLHNREYILIEFFLEHYQIHSKNNEFVMKF